MEIILDDTEARVLGCLIEKELTTPEYYPLSLNALTNACNQKSNRHPVVSFDEPSVERASEGLQQKGLSWKSTITGSRVPKYYHAVVERLDLSRQEMAVLCELLLRGPQTVGELRQRCERMAPFSGMEEIEQILKGFCEQDPPLTAKLPREAGRKECRYAHRFSTTPAAASEGSSSPPVPDGNDERVGKLEQEIAGLRTELEALRQAFETFKAQF